MVTGVGSTLRELCVGSVDGRYGERLLCYCSGTRRGSDSLQGIGSGARIWEIDPDVLLWGRIGTYMWAGRIYYME